MIKAVGADPESRISASVLPDSLLNTRPATSISLTGFTSYTDTAAIRQLNVLTARTTVSIFGGDFDLSGDLFVDGSNVDADRSGVTLNFNPARYLQQLEQQYAPQIQQAIDQDLNRLTDLRAQEAEGQMVLLLEKFISLMNDPLYADYADSIMTSTSHLKRPEENVLIRDSEQFLSPGGHREQAVASDDTAKNLLDFQTSYKKLLAYVQTVPYSTRRNAQIRFDSIRSARYGGHDATKHVLRAQNLLSKVQKHLLNVKRFDLGNTQMDSDGLTSAGLPIRGVHYAFDDGTIKYGLQLGEQISSRAFLPSEGRPFHDLNPSAYIAKVSAGYQTGSAHTVDFSVQYARRKAANANNVALGSRTNTVSTIASGFHLSHWLKASTVFSFASTVSPASNVSLPGMDGVLVSNFLDRSTVSGGLTATIGDSELSVRAFRRGNNYLSFANPYLITDFQGVETAFTGSALRGKLYGQFSLSSGVGTGELSKGIQRWQAFGLVRYQATEGISVGVMVTPNAFRTSISNEDNFSTSNIYQADVTGRLPLGKQPVDFRLCVSNLNQGWTWNDSTEVSNAVTFTSDIRYALSDRVRVVISDQVRILAAAGEEDVSDASSSEWSHAVGFAYQQKSAYDLRLRYEKYRQYSRPGWGLSFAANVPIHKNIAVRLNVYAHLSQDVAAPSVYTGQQAITTLF